MKIMSKFKKASKRVISCLISIIMTITTIADCCVIAFAATTYDISNVDTYHLKAGDVINCGYSGSEKSITLPPGSYKLECWGAKGGSGSSANRTGSGEIGGYSVGELQTNGTTLFLYCGGAGKNASPNSHSDVSGGYNGGGNGQYHGYKVGLVNVRCGGGSGGGATHIALMHGVLSSLSSNKDKVIMVAGGGGAGFAGGSFYRDGGKGGGVSGDNSSGYDGEYMSSPGTQYAGGAGGKNKNYGYAAESGSFGQGGNATVPTNDTAQSGGGGGWYGGGAGDSCGGGGGSGYVADANYAVGPVYLTNAGTTIQTTSTNPDTTENGYIRITVNNVSYPTPAAPTITCKNASGSTVSKNTWVNTNNITFNWSGSESNEKFVEFDHYEYSIDGGSWTTGTSTSASTEGSHTVQVKAVTIIGMTSMSTMTVGIDRT